jgi:hypothetical protein
MDEVLRLISVYKKNYCLKNSILTRRFQNFPPWLLVISFIQTSSEYFDFSKIIKDSHSCCYAAFYFFFVCSIPEIEANPSFYI